MSADKLTWCDKLALSGLIVFLVMIFFGLSAVSYEMERERSAWEYSHALDEPLQPAHMRELHDIRSGLTKWLTSYKELDVPASYGAVYGKVEGFLGEAHELAERFPTMTAPEFQGDLASLRSRLASIEQIGRSVYDDKEPWWRGYVLFWLRMLGVIVLSCCALIAIIWIGFVGSCKAFGTTASST